MLNSSHPPHCNRCPLSLADARPLRRGPVGATPASRLALCGEGPGHVEMLAGRPFVGPSGQHLDWMLAKAGIDRKQLFITNAAMCMPRAVYADGAYFSKAETLKTSTQITCRDRLFGELDVVKPEVVVAFGNWALKSLCGVSGIMKYHGACMPIQVGDRQIVVIPALHPAALLRAPKETHAVIEVLRKAHAIAEGRLERQPERFQLIAPYEKDSIEALERIVAAVLDQRIPCAVDVETNTLDAAHADLSIVGFSPLGSNLGVSTSLLTWNQIRQRFEPAWDATQGRRVYDALRALLESPYIVKWFWHHAFDTIVLKRYFPGFQGPIADAMHWHWLMQPEIGHSLGFAAQTYLYIPPWKVLFWGAQAVGKTNDRDGRVYNALDCIYTAALVPILQSAVTERKNDHLASHQLRVDALARRAETCGVPFNLKAAIELRSKYATSRDTSLALLKDEVRQNEPAFNAAVFNLQEKAAYNRARDRGKYVQPKAKQLAAEDFNPGSPFHARWFLYDHLGLPVERLTKGGADGANKAPSKSYKGVLNYLANPLVKAYVDVAEYTAKLSTLDSVIGKATPFGGRHRLFVEWNTTGTKGTRWASRLINMQNWEKALRQLLEAPDGYCWVGADAQAIEYRCAAALAGIKELITLFNQPAFNEELEPWKKFSGLSDAHSLVAETVYQAEYRDAAAEFSAVLQTWMRKLEKSAKDIIKLAKTTPSLKRIYQLKILLDNWRTLVKRVVYALFYGAMPKKILTSLLEDRRLSSALRALLTLSKVEEVWTGFKARFPEWDRWAAGEMHHARREGYQTFPPFNRRRYWTVYELEENKLRNTPIQLAAGEVCNLIFLNCQDRIDEEQLDATFAIHGHDALYFLTRKEHAPRVVDIVNELFHYDFPGPAGSVHIYGQASSGSTVADV